MNAYTRGTRALGRVLTCLACFSPLLAAAQTQGQAPGQTQGQSQDRGGVTGQDLSMSLAGGVEYTDNVARSPMNEESEMVGIARLSLSLDSDRPRLDTRIGANLEYRNYLDGAFDDELVGGLDGLVSYAVVPERLVWVVTDNFGQVAANRSLADSPDNRQNINFFTTGPDIFVPLGGRTSVELSGRFGDTYYEKTTEDNQSINGTLALVRRLSTSTRLSLNGSTTQVEQDNEQVAADFSITDVFLRWATTTERTQFAVDAGYTETGREEVGGTETGLLVRLDFSRQVTARSLIGVNVGSEFTTGSQSFRRDQTITGINTGADDAVAVNDAFQSDFAFLSWDVQWDRTKLRTVLSARSEEHEVNVTADRDLYAFSLALSRQISRRIELSLRTDLSREDQVETDFEFDERSVGLGAKFLLGESISVSLNLGQFHGSSDDSTRDFDETRAFLGFVYTTGGT